MKNLKSILAIIAVITLFSSCSKEEVNLYYPTDELVSYFSFEGNLRDGHGHTPEGTQSDFGVIYDNGRVGQGVRLDGNSGTIEFDRTSFSTGNSASISFWFKSDSEDEYLPILESSDFYITSYSSTLKFPVSSALGSGTTVTSLASLDFLPNTWMHFVASYDGENWKLYINETSMTIGPLNFTLGRYEKPLTIAPDSDWAGSIDELFIYDKALTEDEVSQLFNR